MNFTLNKLERLRERVEKNKIKSYITIFIIQKIS